MKKKRREGGREGVKKKTEEGREGEWEGGKEVRKEKYFCYS